MSKERAEQMQNALRQIEQDDTVALGGDGIQPPLGSDFWKSVGILGYTGLLSVAVIMNAAGIVEDWFDGEEEIEVPIPVEDIEALKRGEGDVGKLYTEFAQRVGGIVGERYEVYVIEDDGSARAIRNGEPYDRYYTDRAFVMD